VHDYSFVLEQPTFLRNFKKPLHMQIAGQIGASENILIRKCH